MTNRDTTLLHATLRQRLTALNAGLFREKIPLHLYEGVRTPARQTLLYARGRVKGHGERGSMVTRARAWESAHQYGCAADYVVQRPDRSWHWPSKSDPLWTRFHELARSVNLEPLSFERPHIQLSEWSLEQAMRGRLPPGGGEAWEAWLSEQILAWGPRPRGVLGTEHPGAPPWLGSLVCEVERPPLDDVT